MPRFPNEHLLIIKKRLNRAYNMLISLKGTILYHGLGFVIVENVGIGYKVILPEDRAHGLSGEVFLYTHEVVRDDGHELFGFFSIGALELFWKLINVSGVGPKSAQKIVFSSEVEKVKERIMASDVTFLTNVPGIGKKTAQKIILELKGVLTQEPIVRAADQDALEALVSLGYPRKHAEQALEGIEAEDTESKIRAALKSLSR